MMNEIIGSLLFLNIRRQFIGVDDFYARKRLAERFDQNIDTVVADDSANVHTHSWFRGYTLSVAKSDLEPLRLPLSKTLDQRSAFFAGNDKKVS